MNNKITLLGSTVALALLSSAGVQAATIGFDPDGAGVTYSPNAVDVFQWDTLGAYTIDTNLGVDNILGNGDTFTENFRMGLITTEQPAGSATVGYSTGLPTNSHVYFDITLAGSISNYSSAVPVTAADPSGLGQAIFDIAFSGGTFNMFYDPDQTSGTTTPGNDTLLADFTFLGGGADTFSFQNASATADLGLTLLFDTVAPGVWFGSDLTTDLASKVALDLVFAIGDSSVNLVGVAGDEVSEPDHMFITVADNGTTMQVAIPEPAPLALLGLGGLLLGWSIRKNTAKA